MPRDLFNEAKLLKCLGRLTLLIHDGLAGPLRVRHRAPSRGFKIARYDGDGGLYVVNLAFYAKRGPRRREPVHVKSVLNSRAAYPLVFSSRSVRRGDPWDGAAEADVFTDAGGLSAEFAAFLSVLSGESQPP
jgi:hypothetical protein